MENGKINWKENKNKKKNKINQVQLPQFWQAYYDRIIEHRLAKNVKDKSLRKASFLTEYTC